jgi:O-antigen ligase
MVGRAPILVGNDRWKGDGTRFDTGVPAPPRPIVPRVSAARQLAVPLRAALVRHPTLPLAAVALVTFILFAASNGGFDGTTWYPGALIVLALVVIAALTVPAVAVPRIVLVAALALIGYAAWSYLSIGWAAQKGDAWDGANRTLLYALAFALFAVWRPRGRTAVALLILYSVGVATVGLVELLRATAATEARGFFSEGRFASPAGYMNANVALWFTALWPCVVFGARRELHAALRGLLIGAGVLLCGLAVLGQSRGWLFTAPVAALLIVAIVPRRVRTVLTLGLILGVIGVVTGTLLDVYRAAGEPGFDAAVSDAVTALVAAAVIGGLIGAVAAAVERRAPRPSRERERQSGRALAGVAVVATVAGLLVFVSLKGSPFPVISHAWHEFKTEPSPYGGESRFTGSLGTNRYDFWRVGWDRFTDKPLTGLGSDNFQEAYLAERRSDNAPKYPHSVELRTISQTGLVGTALLLVGLGAALWAALLAVRRRRGLGSVAAAAATATFLYWLIHGSIDWFWEFPALGGPAFALLGLAAGLLPRRAAGEGGPAREFSPARARGRSPARARASAARARGRRSARPALVIALGVAAALSFAAPWLAEVQQDRAISAWRTNPSSAFDTLDSAASLNPLNATPKLLAGSIALRLGRKADSQRYFREAIERDPGDAYAHLELGGLLAQAGRRGEALATLERAAKLDPRDDLTAGVLRRVRRGKPVDLTAVNRQLAARSAKLR